MVHVNRFYFFIKQIPTELCVVCLLMLPPVNWVLAHALEALGVVGLFFVFDTLLGRLIQPGFYLFLFALWFLLACMRYYMYLHRHPVYRRRAATTPVATQLWRTSDTFVWVIFILGAFALYEMTFGYRYVVVTK